LYRLPKEKYERKSAITKIQQPKSNQHLEYEPINTQHICTLLVYIALLYCMPKLYVVTVS